MKKRLHKTLALLLSIILLTATAPFNGTALAWNLMSGSDLLWKLDSDGTMTIIASGLGSRTCIPYHDHIESWYTMADQIKVVLIAEGVEGISSYAFSDFSNLTSITVPSTLSYIGDNVFENCFSLSNITVSDDNTSFSSDKDGVLFDKNMTTLIQYPCGRNATEYIIPDSVTRVEQFAFSGCSRLIEVTIPGSVTKMYDAFYNCYGLTSVVFLDGATLIDGNAFFDCTALKNVIIPDSVTEIVDGAFLGCTSLNNVSIPSSVTKIGKDAFGGYYDDNSRKAILIDGFFISCERDSAAHQYAKKNKIPFVLMGEESAQTNNGSCGENLTWMLDANGTLTIQGTGSMSKYEPNKGSWYNKDGIKSVVLTDGVTSIGDSAFRDCSNLVDITISESVTSIEDFAFSHCSKLNNITIPNSVASIGHEAFFGCSGLSSITIPNSVTEIDAEAFYGCSGLTSVTLSNRMTAISHSVFEDCTALTNIVIPESITRIGGGAFAFCTGLTNITIPDSVTSIGSGAFTGCYGLNITIPASVVELEESAIDVSTIICKKNSAAHIYAVEYDIPFVLLGEEPAPTEPTVPVAPSTPVSTTENAPDPTQPVTEPTIPDVTTTEPSDIPAPQETTATPSDIPIPSEATTVPSDIPTPSTATTTPQPQTTKDTPEPVSATTTTAPDAPTSAPAENAKLPDLSNESIKINNATLAVSTLPKTTPKTLRQLVGSQAIGVIGKDGEPLADGALLGTGCRVQLLNANGGVAQSYDVVVPGDTNGDGRVNSADARDALRNAAKLALLDGLYYTAGDTNGDDRVNSADARYILRVAAGLEPAKL